MSSAVLDASAILAYLHREPGGELVVRYLSAAFASAVNVAEVGTRLADRGMTDDKVRQAITDLGMAIAPFDEDQAYASAALRGATRHIGLSLGDRACLALAQRLGLPAVTADGAWAGLDVGVEVRVIREG